MASPTSRHPSWTPAEQHAVSQYLARHAEREVALADRVQAHFERVVVIPVSDEEPDCLDGILEGLGPTCLVVVVVNGRVNAPDAVHAANARLVEEWGQRALDRVDLAVEDGSVAASLLRMGSQHVLVVDRASPGMRFPERQGVGLARKIGCDLALALVARGRVAPSYLACADADVVLPNGYAEALALRGRVSAITFPFAHLPSCDVLLDDATRIAEASWRHYVLGLARAGSPFCYHTIGSALAVEPVAYARARGFPRREGGEDFHLLAKLVKLASVRRLDAPQISIRTRHSARVPFGTGPAVARLLAGDLEAAEFDDPGVFVALGVALDSLRGLVDGRDQLSHLQDFSGLPRGAREAIAAKHEEWCMRLPRAFEGCPTRAHRLRRAFEAFDPLATLRFVHELRHAYPKLPWKTALAKSPYFSSLTRSQVIHMTPAQALRQLASAEALLPTEVGTTFTVA